MENSDFLYKNTDVSIWSTVEPGMGITASSIACMRPLFHAFLSRSKLVGSSHHDAPALRRSRVGYIRSNSNKGTEDFRLHQNLAKSIRVTTVIDTHSARETRDLENDFYLGPEMVRTPKGAGRNSYWDMN